jgi:hypothetical protein
MNRMRCAAAGSLLLLSFLATSALAQAPAPAPSPAPAAPAEPAGEPAPASKLPPEAAPDPVPVPVPAPSPAPAPEPAPEAPPPPAPAPAPMPPAVDPDLDTRLAVLEVYLKDQQPRSRAYYGAWVTMMSLLTVGQAGQAYLNNDDKGTRASYIMGSAFSGVGLALVLIAPSPGRYGYKKFKELPAGTPEEKKFKADKGDEYLLGEAAAVRRTHGWFTHVLGSALGVGGFLGLYFGYDDNLENALRTGLGTIAVTELRIWTRSKRAIRYLDGYRSAPTTMPTPIMLAPMWEPRAQGLMVTGMF